MKKNKIPVVLCLAVAVILIVVVVVLVVGGRDVEDAYKYNTEIISNANAPVAGEPKVDEISGYVEDSQQSFVKLPYALEDTGVEVVSIGKYSGTYTDLGLDEKAEDVLAIVVKNTTDKVISYSDFEVEINDDTTCSFTPTNIPQGQSAIVFAIKNTENAGSVAYSDVEKFECIDSLAIKSDSLPLLEGTVGVDFKDGQFIVTNLTNKDLGDVYIRYKSCSDGNAYLGGITYSAVVFDLKAYETDKVDADDFNADTSVIVAVESILP